MAPKTSAVLHPHLGLELGQPPLGVPLAALLDGLNFRVLGGLLTNANCGWVTTGFPALNGPVMLIATYRNRAGVEKTVFASYKDLYQISGATLVYLTPRYEAGTASVDAADPAEVTGIGTSWLANTKAGDQITFGTAGITSLTATWYTIATVDSDTQLTLTTAVAGAPLGAAAYTIRRLYTGDDSDIWKAKMWIDTAAATDYLYLTNGKDTITRWDGSATGATYSAVGIIAKNLVVFANMMLYLNIIETGNSLPADMINSDVGDPEDILTGLSGQFKVHDSHEGILDTGVLGDNLAIYSGPDPGNVVLAQFVGDPLVFVFRKAVSDTGPISARIVADLGDYHEFLGQDTGYRFDGASLRAQGNQVWQGTLGGRDPSRQHLAFHTFVEEHGEVIWAVPMPSDGTDTPISPPENAFVEHYLEQQAADEPVPYSKRAFPFTASGFLANTLTVTWDNAVGTWDASSANWNDAALLAAFPATIAGDHDGNTYYLYRAHTANGVHLPSFIHFGRRPLNDGVQRGLVMRVYPFMHNPTGALTTIDVMLHLADSAHGEAQPSDLYPLDLPLEEEDFFVSPFRRARFVEIEFQMNELGGVWECAGYDWRLGVSEGIR